MKKGANTMFKYYSDNAVPEFIVKWLRFPLLFLRRQNLLLVNSHPQIFIHIKAYWTASFVGLCSWTWLVNCMLDKSRNKLTLFSYRHHGMMTWSQLIRVTAFPAELDSRLRRKSSDPNQYVIKSSSHDDESWTL